MDLNRAGTWGILQPVADGVKLFFKEEFMPNTADKFLYILGPSLTMLVALAYKCSNSVGTGNQYQRHTIIPSR